MVSKKVVGVTSAAALVLGLSAGTGIAVANKNSAHEPIQGQTEEEFIKSHAQWQMPDGRSIASITESWPKNEYGLTYGTPTNADALKGNHPDLVPVRDDNGKSGFGYHNDLFAELVMPATPKSLAGTGRRLDSKGNVVIDLFEADGKTVTGTYTVAFANE